MQYWRDYRIQKRESLTNAAAVQHSSESKPLPAFISHSASDNKQSPAHDHISRQIDVQYCLHTHINTVLTMWLLSSISFSSVSPLQKVQCNFNFILFNDWDNYSIMCLVVHLLLFSGRITIAWSMWRLFIPDTKMKTSFYKIKFKVGKRFFPIIFGIKLLKVMEVTSIGSRFLSTAVGLIWKRKDQWKCLGLHFSGKSTLLGIPNK